MSNRAAIVSGDGWRAALSLVTLYDQVIAAYPHRTHTADDATIGDAAHQSRTSDHNKNSAGVVCALDLTHDPAGGFDSYAFGDTLLANRDERIKYVISNRRIFYGPRSPSHGGNPSSLWRWEGYNGDNPHDQHIHISVADSRFYDDTEVWNIAAAPPMPDTERPTLQRGSTGEDVQTVQRIIFIDGIYGPVTEQGVKDFQKAHGLPADGIVGRMTWAALLGTSGGMPTDNSDWQMAITTTVFGGANDRNRSAYSGQWLPIDGMYASLPARLTGDRTIDVRNQDGKIVTVSVEDIGPWLVDDPYWQTGTRPIAEDMTKTLTRGPNQGKRPNGAGLDLSPAVFKALGFSEQAGKGKVDWQFHQESTIMAVSPPVGTQVYVPVESATASKVNWTSLVGPIASVLAVVTGGKLNLTGDQILALVMAIQSLQSVATIIFKTFFSGSITPSSAAKV